jgi:hypothetical protein
MNSSAGDNPYRVVGLVVHRYGVALLSAPLFARKQIYFRFPAGRSGLTNGVEKRGKKTKIYSIAPGERA